MKLKIFTDGGARGNPGPAAVGVVVFKDEKIIHSDSLYLGVATNNEAEYQGFLHSVRWVVEQKSELEQVSWYLDSKLVVEQLNKKWKIKEPRLQVYAQEIWKLLSTVSCSYSISHVGRAQNAEADALVNQALDAVKI